MGWQTLAEALDLLVKQDVVEPVATTALFRPMTGG